ncbi:MAG: TonB family protein [bacterium]
MQIGTASDNAMRQYLLYSGSVHTLAFAAFFFLARPGRVAPPSSTYTIDFIGRSGITTVGEKSSPAAPEPQGKEKSYKSEEMTVSASKKKRYEPLPAPSILKGLAKAVPAKTQGTGETDLSRKSASTGVSADFPDFPYPWYVSQVRNSLWNEWSSRMPRGSFMACVVAFSIKRDGNIARIMVEKSSGNKLFDFAAMSASDSAAPFPPLPADFAESQLTVHVEFRVAD